jgi:hypothetical protein
MMNQPAPGVMVWAVENIFKADPTVIDTPKDYWYTAGSDDMVCMKIFMSFFFIPFFHIPFGFLIIPWVVGVPIMAAGMYPMAILFLTLISCLLIRPALT